MVTNVKPTELNYHHAAEKYDDDILGAIPFHKDIHSLIFEFLASPSIVQHHPISNVVELGVGTGLTTEIIRKVFPKVCYRLIDFSEEMLSFAQKKLGNENIRYECNDYTQSEFKETHYEIAVSVIGMHHQNANGIQSLFKSIYKTLTQNGVFIFGDLVTHKDEKKAALNQAYHYHHLVEHAGGNVKTLTDWAHHHMILNKLFAVEDLRNWLQKAGFSVEQKFLKYNTSLMICYKEP